MDRIQSLASWLSVAAVVLVVGWLSFEQLSKPIAHAMGDDAGVMMVADAGDSVGSMGSPDGSPGSQDASAALVFDNTVGDGGLSLLNTMLSDSGAMPSGAPRSVKLGVILVAWEGAEGASASARKKPDALKHAIELAEQARTEWKAAVKAGDSGSSEDIGRIPRGVLEQPTEIAVFSLAAGDISEPLETPRGYWVVKRLE